MKKEKILVIRYRFIGDTVLLVPFLRNLRNNHPEAEIDLTITSTTYDVLKNCPYIDNFIFIDKNNHRHTYELDGRKYHYKKLIKDKKYTKAYVLKRSFSAAWLAFVCGIKKRIGFGTEFRNFLLTQSVPYRADIHEIEAFLDVLRAEGKNVDDGYLELWHEKSDIEFVESILEKNNINSKGFVIIHATSGNVKKQWPMENWRDIVFDLSNNRNIQVVFLGAKSDYLFYEKIVSEISKSLKVKPLNLCGDLTLAQSIAMISKSKLLVGCDSGNLHIAAACNVPVIGIYGPMSAKKWGARGKNNTYFQIEEKGCPCSLKTKCKKNYKCLTSITTSMIKNAIDNYLK